jgi:hypothetical protein
MCNNGPNTNRSQFFIQMQNNKMNWFDKKYVVFGQVIEGIHFLKQIQNIAGTKQGTPKRIVKIINCGRIKKQQKTQKLQEQSQQTINNDNNDDNNNNDKIKIKRSNNDNNDNNDNNNSFNAYNNGNNNRPCCLECGGSLKYVQRIKKTNMIRMRCKECPHAQYVEDFNATTPPTNINTNIPTGITSNKKHKSK